MKARMSAVFLALLAAGCGGKTEEQAAGAPPPPPEPAKVLNVYNLSLIHI